jgi:hypothetical protein
MRRPLLLSLTIALPCVLSGCTGMGVFFDHTFSSFDENPNTPAGNSETLQRIRGETVEIPPLLPEQGNVWPGPTPPDPTLQDIEAQQNSGAPPAPVTGGGTDHQQPRPVPPPGTPPSGSGAPTGPQGSTVLTPRGNSQDVGGGRSYRQLQSPTPGTNGILVPNGNGTSTLISPDGSVQTVPTRP